MNLLASLTVLNLTIALMTVSILRSAAALPLYSQQTGQPCISCHQSGSGGGPLTDMGLCFQDHGHRLTGC
jgi:mono/diheme cytochrome c family protein